MTLANFIPGPRLIDGTQLNTLVAAVNALNTIVGQQQVTIPIGALSGIANSNVYSVASPITGTVIAASMVVDVAATTAAKAATLTGQVNGVSMTGGVISATSANMTPAGNAVASTAITAGNAVTAGQNISFVASAVTTFIEGQAHIVVTIQAPTVG